MVIIQKFHEIYNFCPECSGSVVDQHHMGYSVCDNCGLVLNELVLENKRKRYISGSSRDDSQVSKKLYEGVSPLIPHISLSTSINKVKIYNSDLKRAVKRDSYLTWENRNLLNATNELKRICHLLEIPRHVKYEALRYYKEIIKLDCLRGRSIAGMICACLYFACRKEKLPRFFEEIISVSSVSESKVKKSYKILVQKLNLKSPSINAIHFLPRYISDLNLSTEIENLSIRILKQFRATGMMLGKNPKGVCAGVIYLACKMSGKRVSQSKIAEALNVTKITLRSRYKEIQETLNLRH